METAALKSFHDFSVTDIDGNPFDLSSLKGKKVLVVNTASECGLTPQYAQLQELFEAKGGDGFTIVGFPANNFGGQEPGSDAQIQTFCSKNYGVTFPMMSKISVKGDDIHPLYAWLTSKAENGVEDSKVKWNSTNTSLMKTVRWSKTWAPPPPLSTRPFSIGFNPNPYPCTWTYSPLAPIPTTLKSLPVVP